MYSALELNVKLIKNISISTGYGTRGLQATLNYQGEVIKEGNRNVRTKTNESTNTFT